MYEESANKVMSVLNRYGLKVTNMAYDDETGMIDSLLAELNSEELESSMAALSNVRTICYELEVVEQRFKEKGNEQDQFVVTQNENILSATKLKTPLLAVINDNIVSYHIAMVGFKDEAFRIIADTINTMIESENVLTRSRTSKGAEQQQTNTDEQD